MDEKETVQNTEETAMRVPYLLHERDMARADAREKKLVRAIVIIVITFVATLFLIVGAFLLYLNQYDFTGFDIQQDGEGINNALGYMGGVYNGTESAGESEN